MLFTFDPIFKEFEGIDLEETWNGYVCPAFKKEVADKIADSINEYSEKWDGICGFMEYHNSDGEEYYTVTYGEDVEVYTAMEVDGDTYFPIGAYLWCWSKC